MPVAAVVRFASQRLRDISLAKAAAFGITVIDSEQPSGILRAILAALADNKVVIIQCDEGGGWRPGCPQKQGISSRPDLLERTLAVLQKKQGPEVIFGVMRRERAGYRFCALPAARIASLDPRGVGLPMGAALRGLLERYVMACPEQWYIWGQGS